MARSTYKREEWATITDREHVIVDTNYFVKDSELQFAAWGDLVELQSEGFVKIYVPEMVVLEQVRHSDDAGHRDLNRSLHDLGKSLSVLSKHGIEVPEVDISNLREQRRNVTRRSGYEHSFREKLLAQGVTILPLPALDSGDLVERYLRGRKPFKETGEGIADYIIWRSIIELEGKTPANEGLVLVTENIKDFANGLDLHPDLAADVDESRVRWFPTPKSFVQDFALLADGIASQRFEQRDSHTNEAAPERTLAIAAAESYAENSLMYAEIAVDDESYGDLSISGFEPHPIFESPSIASIELDTLAANWSPYDEFEDGTILGRLDVPAHIGVSGYAYKSDLAVYEGVTVVDSDHNSHMAEVADEVDVRIEFHVRISGEDAEVLNIESIDADSDLI